MSEPYYPNQDPAAGAGAAAGPMEDYYYSGGGGAGFDDFDDYGFDDFGDDFGGADLGGGGGGAAVLGAFGKGDRVMYRSGMDLGPTKSGMYGDDSVVADDDRSFPGRNDDRRGGGGSGAAGGGSRTTNDRRRPLDATVVDEDKPRRRSGRGEDAVSATSRGRVDKSAVGGSTKSRTSNMNRSSSAAAGSRGRGGAGREYEYEEDDEFDLEPYFVTTPMTSNRGGGGPIGKPRFDERGFYYEDENGQKTYIDVDDSEW